MLEKEMILLSEECKEKDISNKYVEEKEKIIFHKYISVIFQWQP